MTQHIHSDSTASIVLVTDELLRRGYTMRQLPIDANRQAVELISPKGGTWLTSPAMVSYPTNTAYSMRIAREKSLGYGYVHSLGFPIPFTQTLEVGETVAEDTATEWFAAYKTLVVKPEASAMSRGLTLNISDYDSLRTAIQNARSATGNLQKVIIQQQVTGEEVRFTLINGKIVAALLRQTARVIGDGKQTVAELIQQENEARAQIRGSMVAYPQLSDHLVSPDLLTSNYVPAAEEVVELNHSTMIKGGASVYNVLSDIHSSYLQAVTTISKSIGAGVIVADIMIEDYTKPMTSTNTYFTEFNGAPALKMYYSCRDGNNFAIVPALADAIDARINV